MSKPTVKLFELVELIRKHGPVSPNRLTELSGDWRTSIDKYIRQAHKARLIHIAAFGPSPHGKNRTVKLYAIGEGVDAKRVYAREREHREAQQRIREKRGVLVKCRRASIFEEATA
jgi:hypothetical protein